MIQRSLLITLTLAAVLLAGEAGAKNIFRATGLTCNDMVSPEGVHDVRLGWIIESDANGTVQDGWQIQVATTERVLRSGRADVWDSGWHDSRQQFDIKIPDDAALRDGTAYRWRVRIRDGNGNVSKWSEPAYFSTGLRSGDWQAEWISASSGPGSPMPYFRREVDLGRGRPSRAVIYLCGLGCSELYFNGMAVDPTRVLDPAQTDYEKRALYTTFDVTDMLSPDGLNCIGVMLGDGWYGQDTVWHPSFRYGRPMLLCRMDAEYPDGTVRTIVSDDSWKWIEGPILRSNVYQGMTYDARREIEGWCTAGLDDSAWHATAAPDGPRPAILVPQDMAPIREHSPVPAVDMWRSGDKWIYDFGANRTANIRFTVELPAGTKLTVRTGEALNEDRTIDFWSTGIEHVGYQQDVYICKGGGPETWTPRFTYHGFRYGELTVEGCDRTPGLDWLAAVPVHNDLEVTGSFECSDEQVNRLHRIAVHTMKANFVGVPVDCPQREKCGWLGDTHAYARMANLNLAMNGFWTKYLGDIRTGGSDFIPNTLFHERNNSEFYWADKPAGVPFMIAPGRRQCGVASPDWGTALVQLPWYLYVYYGNREILEEYYDLMKVWTDHISSTAVDGIIYQGLGDWCPPGNTRGRDTPIEFTSTAFHYLDLSIMAEVAALTGRSGDAGSFARQRDETGEAIRRKFYHPFMKSFGSQTANAMALELGLVPAGEEEAVAADMVRLIGRQNGFFHMGIFGLCRGGSALSRNGMGATAWDTFTKTGNHSFGYMLDEVGVTTLWEELPVSAARAYQAGRSSQSHPMQGGYDVWFYEDVAGIRPYPADPGFATTVFDPLFTGGPEWARASVKSRYGTISSDWSKDGERITWRLTIPANTSGLVAIPLGYTAQVNGKTIGELYNIEKQEKGRDYNRISSGTYEVILTPVE